MMIGYARAAAVCFDNEEEKSQYAILRVNFIVTFWYVQL